MVPVVDELKRVTYEEGFLIEGMVVAVESTIPSMRKSSS
jgi:hypothetical protein